MKKGNDKTDRKAKYGWRLPDSIYLKCLFALAVSTALTIGLVTLKSLQATNSIANGSIMKIGAEVVTQMGERTAAPLRFRKSNDVTSILQDTIIALRGSASGAVVLATDGEIIALDVLEGHGSDFLLETAQTALSRGDVSENVEHLVIAVPIRYGESNEMIGVIALDWRTDVLYAAVAQQKRITVMLAVGVALIMLLVVGLQIKRTVAKPLISIASAMKEISGGNYATEVPRYRRGNEIGVVARTLEEFRNQLKASDASRKDAAMRSAALDAGSASMMIADAECKIIYVSPATVNLLTKHSHVIGSRISGFEPAELFGKSLAVFDGLAELHPTMLEALGPQGHRAILEIDQISLGLTVSRIDSETNERIGYVLEWADVSEERLNAAILGSLDCNQARAEFDQDGRLLDSNAAFRALSGFELPSQTHSFSDVIFRNGEPVQQDKAEFSEFEIRGQNGVRSFILGGLSPVFSSSGDLKRTVLIGADVTEDNRKMAEAAEDRKRLRSEQEAMITALSQALSALAGGDLSVRIKQAFSGANDRIRQDFNVAIEQLEEAILSVISSATTIRSEVEGVASAATELSKRTENQAATLEETAAAVSEISASVTSSAAGATSAREVVNAAQGSARASGEVVKDAVSAMNTIAQSSSEITSIIKVIDDIAFQTNLLALNAGVEAARAGDAGRGFAVVASEVRALAQRSSDAASEIRSLIATSSENVGLGVKLVGDAGEALERIIVSISDISGYVSQIAGAAEEQSSSIAEINSAMGQLDQVTQQNAAMFEETTAASQNLSAISNELTDRVQRFSVAGEATKVTLGDKSAMREIDDHEPAELRSIG